MHLGFSSALKRTWDQVESVLETAKDKPLFLAGHSMGGAGGVDRLPAGENGTPADGGVHVRRPRVGDRTFCAGYAIPTYRIVNRLDLVPEIPLASVKRLLPAKFRSAEGKIVGKIKQMAGRVPCYGHVKTFVYIDRDGVITADAEVEPWHMHAVARAIATRGKSFHEGITDHLIGNYIRGLEGQIGKKQTGVRRRIRVD